MQNKLSMKLVKNFLLVLVLFLGFFLVASSASAATYYVRADGTVTAGNKANATDPTRADASLNMAQVKTATFVAGDYVLFSSQGGDFAVAGPGLVLPSSGSGVGNEITYGNVPSETPIITSATANEYLLNTNLKSNVIIDGLTLNYTGTLSTVAGTYIRTGSNIQFKNITSDLGGYGYNIYSSFSILSNITFDNLNLTRCKINICLGLAGGSASYSNVLLQNSTMQKAQIYNADTVTISNSSFSTGIDIGTGSSNITINNIPATGGIYFLGVNTATISNVVASGTGIDIENSANITVNNSSVTGGTDIGAFHAYGTSNNIIYNNCTANNNSGYGFIQGGTAANITVNNCVANYNSIGFVPVENANNVTYNRCEASYNGPINVETNGGGFMPHASTTNIRCNYCIAHHNFTNGFTDVGTGTTIFYNTVSWDNGYSIGETYRGGTVATASTRGNTYISVTKTAGTMTMKNMISGLGKPFEIMDSGNGTKSTFDYNLYYPVDNNVFWSDYLVHPNKSWSTYYTTNGNEPNSKNGDPLFTNASSNDFTLTYLSPAIDAGVDVGLTQDYLGKSIYGLPDIGAYEYQPPYTMGTNEISTSAPIRMYGDEKFRNKSAPTGGDTAEMSVAITGSDTLKWLDIQITDWQTTGNYAKAWTEGEASSSIGNIAHTIGDLRPNINYNVKVDNVLGANITGCTSGVCLSNGSGQITFTYTGGYSTHAFTVEQSDITPPTITITEPNTNPAQSKTITASATEGTLTQSITTGSVCDGTLTFGAYAETTFTLESDNGKKVCYKAVDSSNNIAYQLSSAIAGIDTVAPTISNLSPDNSTFPVTTTSATISLTTSETANCKYSTTSGVAYASMTAFSNTNSNNHSSLITNLTSGTTYHYYFKCKDTALNETGESTLSFSVAPVESNATSIEKIKISIGKTINKFKDTIHIAKNKFKLKQKDSSLANGQVKIYKGNKLWKTITIDAQGVWSQILKLKDKFSGWLKIKQYDQYGTQLSNNKAKIKVDKEKPVFTKFITPYFTISKGDRLYWEATDNQGIDKYKVYFNGQIKNNDKAFYDVPKETKNGLYTIRVKAYDQAGNIQTKQTWVRVVN